VRKFPVFPGPATQNVGDRLTLVPEKAAAAKDRTTRSSFINLNANDRELSATRPVFSRLLNQGGKHMKKLLISTAVAAFAVTSAFAQATVSEYYVVRDATTKKCTIVDKRPTTTTTTVVDNGTFKTRTEAETGMKSMKVCTEN
jgi:hypothetical protein